DFHFSRRVVVYHLRDLARDHIGGDADHALCADGHEWERQGVIAAHDFKARTERRAELADAIGTASSLFNANHIFTLFRQTFDGIHANLHAATARDAIEHYRQAGFSRDLAEVLKKPFLRWFIVVRRDL